MFPIVRTFRFSCDFTLTVYAIFGRSRGCLTPISLNRIGTNPLEHHFRLLRLKAHFKHSFANVILNENKLRILNEIQHELIANFDSTRRKIFGQIIHSDGLFYGSGFEQNKKIAYAMLERCGLPVKLLGFRMKKCEIEMMQATFLSIVEKTVQNEITANSKFIVRYKDFSCGSSGYYIRHRMDLQINNKIKAKCTKNACTESQPIV